jgi:hypothetical protein
MGTDMIVGNIKDQAATISKVCFDQMHRFVLLLAKQHDYFFVLYIVNFVAEGWLALLALFYYPSLESMEALPEDPNNPVYEVMPCCPFDDSTSPVEEVHRMLLRGVKSLSRGPCYAASLPCSFGYLFVEGC